MHVHGSPSPNYLTETPGARPWILVVDDDPALRESAYDALLDAGYDSRGAAHGREALELSLRARPPELILLDLMMPDMDGWEFRRAQRGEERIRDVPVVVMTAARDLGPTAIDAASILLKPFRLDQLLDEVQRLIPEGPAQGSSAAEAVATSSSGSSTVKVAPPPGVPSTRT